MQTFSFFSFFDRDNTMQKLTVLDILDKIKAR